MSICVLSAGYGSLSSVLPKVKESGKSHSVHVMRGGLRVSPGGKRHHLHDRLICVYCKLIKKLTVGNAREEGYIISTLFAPLKRNHDSLLIEMHIFASRGLY